MSRTMPYDQVFDQYFNDSTDYSTLTMLGINTDDIDTDKLTDDYINRQFKINRHCNVHYNEPKGL